MEKRIEQMQRAERARKILQTIEWRITELQILPNDEIMSGMLFRMMLREHPDMQRRFDILEKRKECIKRFIWQNA